MEYRLISPTDATVSPLTRVLFNRGLTQSEMLELIALDDHPISYDPTLLKNINLAATRLLEALINQEKIYLQVD